MMMLECRDLTPEKSLENKSGAEESPGCETSICALKLLVDDLRCLCYRIDVSMNRFQFNGRGVSPSIRD